PVQQVDDEGADSQWVSIKKDWLALFQVLSDQLFNGGTKQVCPVPLPVRVYGTSHIALSF
ncbi:MAG: hypothetical protein WAW61_07425, partial [Methylococcaceae bacterium]